MAKVGVLSMQRIINYGSFLQAYGLKMLLEELGHTVEFVDYRVEKPLIQSDEKKHTSAIFRKINKALEVLQYDAPFVHRIQYIIHKKQFADKYFSVLGIKSEMNYKPELDVLVIGSDEVFNCVQKNINVGYSLELFGKDNHAKKLISYAASFGNTTADKLKRYNKAKEISALLEKFDAISVRDSNSGSIVEQLTDRVPEYHLDPVLAYDYINKCKEIPEMKSQDKYLILYAYAGRVSEQEADWIRKYAQKRNLKIYAIGGAQKYADRFVDCNPFEVLAYFQNAEAVITDTFHGTIFSIIARRTFATIVRKSDGISYGNEEKITDLLSRVVLSSQMATDMNSIEEILSNTIDYSSIEQVLNIERARTIEYLAKQTIEN
jgi:hypothetical protein